MTAQFEHVSVLMDETIDALAIKPDGIYMDGTFGRGGHSGQILARLGDAGRLQAIDQDPQAIKSAEKFADDSRFQLLIHDSRNYTKLLSKTILLVKLMAFYLILVCRHRS